MSWSVGFSDKHSRDVGYGVPCICEHPDCDSEIDRGLSYVCGDMHDGGESGCGLYFCSEHRRSHYTDYHCTAILAELVETLMLTHEHFDEALESVMEEQPLMCERCAKGGPEFDLKPDTQEWIDWKETDPSWQGWRDERDASAVSGGS
mgnify:CR=1 FL=1